MGKNNKSKKSSNEDAKKIVEEPKKSKKDSSNIDTEEEFSDDVTYENNNDIELKNKSFKNNYTNKENLKSEWNSGRFIITFSKLLLIYLI